MRRSAAGFRRGHLSEVTGAPSSGRTTIVVAGDGGGGGARRSGRARRRVRHVRSGVGRGARPGPARVSWVRETGDAARALKAFSLILQAGGFGLVVLDLADVPAAALRRFPCTTWMRIARIVEGSETVALLVGGERIARSAGGVTVALRAVAALPGAAPPTARACSPASQPAPRVVRARHDASRPTTISRRAFRTRSTPRASINSRCSCATAQRAVHETELPGRCTNRPFTRRRLYACLRTANSELRTELQTANCELQTLLAIARDFSPRVMVASDGEVLLDVSGLGRLIGEPPAIAAALARALFEAGLDGQRGAGGDADRGAAARHASPRLLRRPDSAASARDRCCQPLETLPPAMNHRDRARPYETFARWGIAHARRSGGAAGRGAVVAARAARGGAAAAGARARSAAVRARRRDAALHRPPRARVAARDARAAVVRVRAAARAAVGGARARGPRRGRDPPGSAADRLAPRTRACCSCRRRCATPRCCARCCCSTSNLRLRRFAAFRLRPRMRASAGQAARLRP